MKVEFVLSKEVPKELNQGEIVIEVPNFIDQVKKSKKTIGNITLTSALNLRGVLFTIAEDFDLKTTELDVYRDVRVNDYRGISFSNEKELANIVFKAINDCKPDIIKSILTKKINERPVNTKLIYLNSDDEKYASVFEECKIARKELPKKEAPVFFENDQPLFITEENNDLNIKKGKKNISTKN